ncbi:hypothetical protein JXO52_09695 [bacterium]|nr:hypothetical protein [bacterium]
MKELDKKKRAAICGVIAYLQMREAEGSEWSKSGKELAMKNRHMVQTKLFNRRES